MPSKSTSLSVSFLEGWMLGCVLHTGGRKRKQVEEVHRIILGEMRVSYLVRHMGEVDKRE